MLARRHLLKLSAFLILGIGGAHSATATAAEAQLMQAELTVDEPGQKPGLFLSASYEFDFPHTLYEALHRGIALYFAHEFTLSKNRWFWLDKTVVSDKFLLRIAFNPLTQRYRLSYNGFSQDYDTLDQVMPYIKSVRRWRVADISEVKSSDYEAQARFYLDTSKLPKAMQVTNTSFGDWTIDSGWETISIPFDLLGLK